jgi:hypothetical protein
MVQVAMAVGGARYGNLLRSWMRMGAMLDLLLHEGDVQRFYVHALVPPSGRKPTGFHVGLEAGGRHRFYRPRVGGRIPASVELYFSGRVMKVGALEALVSDVAASVLTEVDAARKRDADSAFRFTVLIPRPVPVIARVEAESLAAADRLLAKIARQSGALLHDLRAKGKHAVSPRSRDDRPGTDFPS